MIKKVCLTFLIIVSITIGQEADSSKARTPKKAALWSILPGGGQIYNRKYLKAGIIITLESVAVAQSIKNGNSYKNSDIEDDLLNRNKFAWWAFLVHIYGLLDAIVDSHLEPFNPIMEGDSLIIETKVEEIQPDG